MKTENHVRNQMQTQTNKSNQTRTVQRVPKSAAKVLRFWPHCGTQAFCPCAIAKQSHCHLVISNSLENTLQEAVRKVAPNGRAVRNGIHEGIWIVSLATGNWQRRDSRDSRDSSDSVPNPWTRRHQTCPEQHDATMLKIH